MYLVNKNEVNMQEISLLIRLLLAINIEDKRIALINYRKNKDV
jgi:hypothetical protein